MATWMTMQVWFKGVEEATMGGSRPTDVWWGGQLSWILALGLAGRGGQCTWAGERSHSFSQRFLSTC